MKLYHGTQEHFNKFDLGFSLDMGFHFAVDSAQAAQRIQNTYEGGHSVVFVCDVKPGQSIELPDIGDWADHQILAEAILDTQQCQSLRAIADKYIDLPYSFTADSPHLQMRAEIIAAGYDSIQYANVAEGYGTSYMVLDPARIAIINRI